MRTVKTGNRFAALEPIAQGLHKTFHTQGIEHSTGRIVNMAFGRHNLAVEYAQPVDVDPVTKEIKGINGISGRDSDLLSI